MTRRRRFTAALCLLALCAASPVEAKPSVWDVAKNPGSRRADELFALAERSRVPAEDALDDVAFMLPNATSRELQKQLNARAAALISIGAGDDLGDIRLLYLLGDALGRADESYLPEAEMRLRQALERDPASPLAADAWFSLAVVSGKLNRHAAERAAYTEALAQEWDPDLRATILTNRGESSMVEGDLKRAIGDYRSALQLARSAEPRALALWNLAVATERDGDLPSALPIAREAGLLRFGHPSHPIVALDLPLVYFNPDYDEHYYRALGSMADALAESRPEQARRLFQTASLLWSLYVNNAAGGGLRWVPNAKQHRDRCRAELERLDQTPGRAKGKPSVRGSDED